MMGPFRRLAEDKLALAYTVFFYAEHMAPRENTRLIAVDGVMPTSETIRKRQYQHVAECFVVVRKDAAVESPAVRLRDWLLAPAGQDVVVESGYVPVGTPEGKAP
jgi:phosphate transport system substrate-binding protein